MGSIRERILTAEGDLLHALLEDAPSVEKSCAAWESLSRDLHQAIQAQSLDHETVELAHATTSRVAIISEGLLDFFTKSVEISSKFRNELDNEFSKLSVAEGARPRHIQGSSPSVILSPPPTPAALDQSNVISVDIPASSFIPPYIAPAYKWLLEHLHDPYPSNEVKQSISDSTGTSVKHVNAWFMNVRRRMGWTAISRKHFSGNRTDTVNAAHRALVSEDSRRPLESNIILEFVEMKVTAEGLYFEKFGRNVVAAKLDLAVKDLTDAHRTPHISTKAQADYDDLGCGECDYEIEKDYAIGKATSTVGVSVPTRPELSYPSPQRSSCGSPVPFSPDSPPQQGEGDSSLPSAVAGRKRRMSSCSAESDDISNDSFDHPCKRLRRIVTKPVMILPPSPKSPTLTTFDASDDLEENILHSSRIPTQSAPISKKRRLSLSDAIFFPTPKRPRNLPIGSRMQVVSDPIPTPSAVQDTSQFEKWFMDHFEPPDPVTTDDLDHATLVDVDIHNGWTYLDGPRIGNHANLYQQAEFPECDVQANGTQSIHVEPLSTLINNPAVDPNKQSQPVGSAFELDESTPENSTREFADNVMITNQLSSSPLSVDCSSPTSTFENDLSHLFNAEDLLSLPKWSLISAPEHKRDLPQLPASSSLLGVDVSWTQYAHVLPFEHNPNIPSLPQAFFDDIISQELPPLDPSLFIPLTPSTVSSTNSSYESYQLMAEKQAKLEKLQKHREEVRKLEVELAL